MGNADKRGTVQGNGRLSRSGGNIEKIKPEKISLHQINASKLVALSGPVSAEGVLYFHL